jgi:adenine-specific DNA-methyltransferase
VCGYSSLCATRSWFVIEAEAGSLTAAPIASLLKKHLEDGSPSEKTILAHMRKTRFISARTTCLPDRNLHSLMKQFSRKEASALITSSVTGTDEIDEEPLLQRLDITRIEATTRIAHSARRDLGQFFTPSPVAMLMARMFGPLPREVRLLDAGAGSGMLTAAFVLEACRKPEKPDEIRATLWEIDKELLEPLQTTLAVADERARESGIRFKYTIRSESFIDAGAQARNDRDLFCVKEEGFFTHAILNPPFRKMNANSQERIFVSNAGLETGNLYTAFVFIACRLLLPKGELVAITPRSFCNGPYFLPFRAFLHNEMAFRRIHIFRTRDAAFGDDNVLQENVIYSLTKGGSKGKVFISSSEDAKEIETVREVDHKELLRPDDPDLFIRLAIDEHEGRVADLVTRVSTPLSDLGLTVSTGRVVDFRASAFLRKEHGAGTVALLYPKHLRNGGVIWPVQDFKKCDSIAVEERSQVLLIPTGFYVLVKRFSAKEEARRIVASVLSPRDVPGKLVGVENHLNYFHAEGQGLDRELAVGLAIFLNSSAIDRFFRQFNGHTQVNATDLRSLRYPELETLRAIGRRFGCVPNDQMAIDEVINQEVLRMPAGPDPFKSKRRIEEALSILGDLGLPREQRNDRSSLTLLALLDLTPEKDWSAVRAPLRGITEMMTFFKDYYGKEYAPNTRETVRRYTMHQFVQAGLAIENPDDPGRPTNSPKWCYQIRPQVLELARLFGAPEWESALKQLISEIGSLNARYACERKANRIPVVLMPGREITLSPGGQNFTIKAVIDEFCPVFAAGAHVVYVGDASDKWGYFDKALLASLGVMVESHGKMPDIVIYDEARCRLILIEAVTSHGPVSPKRHAELQRLFAESKADLIFVSAFPNTKTLHKYLSSISWETEVWCADAPTHMIHFNGERFLGPR